VAAKSWWGTVDGLGTRVAGPVVAAHPELRAVMDRWVEGENIWPARVADLPPADRSRAALRLLPTARRRPRVLHSQGDRLRAPLLRQGRWTSWPSS
jgi:DNA alkylation repair enzyme